MVLIKIYMGKIEKAKWKKVRLRKKSKRLISREDLPEKG